VGIIILVFGIALAGDLTFRTAQYYYPPIEPGPGIEFVRLQSPLQITQPIGDCFGTTVYGLVFGSDLTTPPGPTPNLEFQVGAGHVGIPLDMWTFWVPASYAGDEAGADRFAGSLAARFSIPGEYRFAVRARLGGGDWVYGDADASANGIQDDQLGRLFMTGEDPPFGCPCPQSLLFAFQESMEDWQAVNPTRYAPPNVIWLPDNGGEITLVSTNNTNTFGYIDSPYVDLGNDLTPLTRGREKVEASGFEPAPIYWAEFYVRSAVEDRAEVPQFRFRTNALSLQQAAYVTLESRADGSFSPDGLGRRYTMLFSPPPTDGVTQFSFDLLNFDATDAPEGDGILSWMRVSLCGLADVSNQQLLYRYTFDTDTENWTPQTTTQYTPPVFGHETGALTITGSGDTNTFGYYVSPAEDVIIDPTLLYVTTFEVESSLPASERAACPQFRVRLNEDGYHASGVVVVESRGDGVRSPVAGEPIEYVVYFLPPESSGGKSLLASFDLLNFDALDNGTATLKLNRVDIEAVPYLR